MEVMPVGKIRFHGFDTFSGKVGAAVKGLVLSVVGVYRFHGVLRRLQLFQFGF